MFDKQLDRMFQLIDHQLSKMAYVAPHDSIVCHSNTKTARANTFRALWCFPEDLVVRSTSGNDSSNAMSKTQQQLIDMPEMYTWSDPDTREYAVFLSLILTSLSQAAPVKGLLHNRLELGPTLGPGILTERISRFSLGVVCDALYNPLYHVNQELYQDPTDGQRYARNQITWFIRKGDRVSDKLIAHSFFRTLKKHEPREPWTSRIVLSHRAGEPPRSLQEGMRFQLVKVFLLMAP